MARETLKQKFRGGIDTGIDSRILNEIEVCMRVVSAWPRVEVDAEGGPQ